MGTWNVRIALAAALILVLQAMTSALAVGLSAVPTELDAFGNPICLTGSIQPDDTTGHGDHHQLPDCCTMGCSMVSAVAVPPSQGPVLVIPQAVSAGRPTWFRQILLPPAPDHDPSSPRAPPRLA